MELKTLFTAPHEKVRVSAAAMLLVERSSGEPVPREMHLLPAEELTSLLYVGCSDCTLHVCRIVTRMDQEGVRYDVSTTLLRGVTLTSANAVGGGGGGGGGSSSRGIALQGITFLHVNNKLSTPQLLVLADGTLNALHYSSLDSTGLFQPLSLPPGGVTTCCVARGQEDTRQQRMAVLIKERLFLLVCTEQRAYFFGCGADANETPALDRLPQIVVHDGVQTLAWQHNIIVTGSPLEYCVFDVNTYQLLQQVEVTGALTHGPLCRYMNGCGDNSYVLVRMAGDQLVLFNGMMETDLETTAAVRLSEPVVDVACASPFLVGVKADGHMLLQSWLDGKEFPYNSAGSSSSTGALLRFDGIPHHMYSTPLGVYVVCANRVQLLLLMPRKSVITLYIHNCLYERALLYAEHVYSGGDGASLRNVYGSCARHALQRKMYSEAFRYFDLAGTRILELLELVPELQRPLKAAKRREHTVKCTWSSGKAYHQLYELLLRHRAAGSANDTEEQGAIEFAIFLLYVLEFVPYTNSELADMFLFSSTLVPAECLLYVGDDGMCPKPMILPLVLAYDGRFEEALGRCQAQRLVHEAAIVLQMSGDEQLYAQHLPWMLVVDANAALLAVVQPHQRRPPPAAVVLPMLLGYGNHTLQKYLDFLVYVDNNTEPHLHTLYATNLINMLCNLQSFGVDGVKSNAAKLPAGDESGVRGATRRALLAFLRHSQYYEADVLLSLLLNTGLVEEQVLVFERLGDHWGALRRLVYDLDNINGAVRYCEEHYARELYSRADGTREELRPVCLASDNVAAGEYHNGVSEERSSCRDGTLLPDGGAYMHSGCRTFNEYFNMLLHVLLVPPEGKPRLLSAALSVLNEHSDSINPLSVMASLPNEVCVAEISSYLMRAFQTLCSQAQMAEINANTTASMLADAQRYHSLLCQRCVYVDENRQCAVCGKPLGVGVMAIFPNLKATHFRCFRTHELDPERGVPFRVEL